MNQGPDRGAAWLPEGSGILYSSQQLGRRDNDVCLALIPATGGSQRHLTCDLSPTGADSADAIESPAPTPDGRLAFVARASRIEAITPENISIAVGSLRNPSDRTRVQIIPCPLPGGPLHSGASQLRWLAPDLCFTLPGRRSIRLGGVRGGLYVDVRNLLNRRNIVTVRRDTGEPGLTAAGVDSLAEAAYQLHPEEIPFESARYRAFADANGDGYLSGREELFPLYQAAAHDFTQPLFAYGPPRLVRLGLEFLF